MLAQRVCSFAVASKSFKPMLRKAPTVVTYFNRDRETNLSAAKQALRHHRGACLHRDITGDDDVVNVVVGAEIMERHTCKMPHREPLIV